MAANAPRSLRSNPAGRLVGGAGTGVGASLAAGNAAGAATDDCGGSNACKQHANSING